MNDYLTIESEASFEFVERKSRFIGHCFPVSSEADVDEKLNALRKTYWDARHNCYAFRLGPNGNTARSSDDGEPSGTAGVPILNVLVRSGMTNVLVVVTRYFGGILLGAGGLIRAYSKAAAGAIHEAGPIRMVNCREIRAEIPYPLYQSVDRLFREASIPADAQFTDKVELSAFIPQADAQAMLDCIVNKTEGRCRPTLGDSRFLPFRVKDLAGLEEGSNEE